VEVSVRRRVSLVLVFICFLLDFSCKKEEPCTTCPPPQGPDTTSHNFTFTQFTFGGSGGSSYFKDVAIVSDSDIWAVGMIYTDSLTYNAAHWDGTIWRLIRVPVPLCGSGTTVPFPLQAVIAFGSNDVWMSGGGDIEHWDGHQFTWSCDINGLIRGAITKMWGASPANLWAVGNGGTILHFANGTWLGFEGGTNIDLRDVSGTSDGSLVWACGYSNDLSRSCLLRYDRTAWSIVWLKESNPVPPFGDLVLTGWSSDKFLYIGAADGVYRTPLPGDSSARRVLTLPSVPHRIRGSAENNIAVACDDQSIWHYNGATWLQATPGEPLKPLLSVAVSANSIVSVGFDATGMNWEGRIVVGKRTNTK
jgi:hypothetical protein